MGRSSAVPIFFSFFSFFSSFCLFLFFGRRSFGDFNASFETGSSFAKNKEQSGRLSPVVIRTSNPPACLLQFECLETHAKILEQLSGVTLRKSTRWNLSCLNSYRLSYTVTRSAVIFIRYFVKSLQSVTFYCVSKKKRRKNDEFVESKKIDVPIYVNKFSFINFSIVVTNERIVKITFDHRFSKSVFLDQRFNK